MGSPLTERPVDALYVDVLEELLENRLTPEIFDALLADTGDALLRLLERDSVREAMAKVSGPNESVLELERLSGSFERSWERLKRRIARYRRITANSGAQ